MYRQSVIWRWSERRVCVRPALLPPMLIQKTSKESAGLILSGRFPGLSPTERFEAFFNCRELLPQPGLLGK